MNKNNGVKAGKTVIVHMSWNCSEKPGRHRFHKHLCKKAKMYDCIETNGR